MFACKLRFIQLDLYFRFALTYFDRALLTAE